jgi:DNA-directed RNA polymerase specialized sigma24 family protein
MESADKPATTHRLKLFAELLNDVAERRDRQTFVHLFEHFGPRLKGFMMRKGANTELAEDLVQDAMIAVWNKAAMFSPLASLSCACGEQHHRAQSA